MSRTCKVSECIKMEETAVERAGKGHSRQMKRQVQSSGGRRPGRPGDQGGGRACLASEQWGKEERERALKGEVGI